MHEAGQTRINVILDVQFCLKRKRKKCIGQLTCKQFKKIEMSRML